MVTAQLAEATPAIQVAPLPTLPSWRQPNTSTGHTRFRQLFLDHWDRRCDLRLEDEVPFDQRANTFGRDMEFEPHTHLVMPLGGLKDGQWVEIELPPPPRLSAKWRYLLCKHLQQARPHDRQLRWAVAQGYRDHGGYQIHCSALDFISRLIPHIPPKDLQVVRYAGLYARCVTGKPPSGNTNWPRSLALLSKPSAFRLPFSTWRRYPSPFSISNGARASERALAIA